MQEARKTNIEAKKKEKQLEAYKTIVEESQKNSSQMQQVNET